MKSESAAPADHGSPAHIKAILAGLMLGMFLGALDQTIVATAIRTIADDLNGLSAQAWVTTAYLITSTITTPIYGKLGDLYGRKKLFLFAITIFILGSFLCAFAQSMYMLAAFRAFQGLGAGGLFTLVLAIIGDLVPPRERAKYTGYFMATFATSSVLGPVIGGLFAGAPTILGLTGWRWVFMVNVPIGIFALVVISRTLQIPAFRREARIDWWGAITLVIGLVPLLTVAEQGREWGWGSGKSLTAYAIGILGLAAFVFAEWKMADDALIPLRLFKIRAASVTIVASVIVGMAMFGGITVLPLYLQIVHGASPMVSGFEMLPMVAGMMIAAITSGQLTARTGRVRPFPIIGTAIAAIGLFLLHWISADSHLWLVMIFMFIVGIGIGNCMQPLTIIVQNAVPPQEIGVATSAATFFRQVGGTMGVAIFLSILFSTVGDKIADAFKVAAPGIQQAVKADPSILDNPLNKAVVEGDQSVLAQVQNNSAIINKMADVIAHPFKVGFSDSIDLIFLCAACVMVLGFLVTLLMPKVTLRSQSPAQEAAAAAEALG
ncbi:EmrB/QacA subfamily drug resistance transporter [Branchiibius hedensis]|uniref:Drug resistance transporter, EmrB/QacA subfamily n=1 Tax=Branchiibius hedensis TaxID=672460 RepID=A0A2Y8ZVK9_9MICO|nr:MDR family MFS transporter [Branchiibius hedensis]PWJ27303.1 EmrB/QacA subfamily drug resistance transporter [Branchiibius hedensis]SSA36114.1 drug resistance transporter, EmrB/QacA subfamily [Branchiibius hedensis]